MHLLQKHISLAQRKIGGIINMNYTNIITLHIMDDQQYNSTIDYSTSTSSALYYCSTKKWQALQQQQLEEQEF